MAIAILIFQGVVTGVLLVSLMVAVLQPYSKTLYFPLLMLVVAFYCVGSFFEMIASSFEGAVMAWRMQMLGLPHVGVVFYLYIRNFYDRKVRDTRFHLLLYIIPTIAIFTSISWPLQSWYYKDVFYITDDILPSIGITPGPLYYLSNAFTILIYSAGVFCIIKEVVHPRTASRKLSVLLLVIALVPMVSGVVFVSPIFGHVNLLPASLAITCLLYWYITIRYRLADWTLYARERVLEHIHDAYVLLSPDDRFLDHNSLAQEIFPELRNLGTGRPISLVPGFPHPDLSLNENQIVEFEMGPEENRRFLRASFSPIVDHKRIVAVCVLLYDITENHTLMEELNTMATQDHLTGLLNRRTFYQLAENDFAMALRTGRPAAMIMIDIDFFKKVNDRFGHLMGDEVLKVVAQLISSSLRKTDIIGRYGGEEICVFLPGTDDQGALLVAESLRRAVARYLFEADDTGERHFKITISLGLSFLDRATHETVQDMTRDADTALYQAKAEGRNCVRYTGTPQPTGQQQASAIACPTDIPQKV